MTSKDDIKGVGVFKFLPPCHQATCDFVVWSGPSSQLIRAYPGANQEEAALLASRGRDGPAQLTSSLVRKLSFKGIVQPLSREVKGGINR